MLNVQYSKIINSKSGQDLTKEKTNESLEFQFEFPIPEL